jgi:lipopolysaccharide/colanic/teichoic acid biosynthesis glycosyltransferase
LDEIPQVINILSGSMSFIGPRPERPELVAELEQKIPFYRTRLLVKPGLTGWDQISGNYHSPSVTDTMEKLQHDLYYLKHRSLYLDVTIILKTFATVIFHEGR